MLPLKLIQEMQIPNLILKVNHVVQTASYHSIIPMTQYFDESKIEIHPILLTQPKHFHISSLTKDAKQQFLNDTENYQGYNSNFINFVRSASAEHIEQKTAHIFRGPERINLRDHEIEQKPDRVFSHTEKVIG